MQLFTEIKQPFLFDFVDTCQMPFEEFGCITLFIITFPMCESQAPFQGGINKLNFLVCFNWLQPFFLFSQMNSWKLENS